MTSEASYLPLPEDPAKRFVEAYGGYVMAPAFLVALLVLLSLQFVTPVLAPPKAAEPIRVTLNEPPPPAALAPAAPTPEPENEAEEAAQTPVPEPPEFIPPAPQRTVAEDAQEEADFPETAAPVEPLPEPGQPDAPESAEPAEPDHDATLQWPDPANDVPKPAPPEVEPPDDAPPLPAAGADAPADVPEPADQAASEEEARVQAERQAAIREIVQRRQAVAEENKEVGKRGSDAVADRLHAAQVQQQSKKWLTTTDGVDQGVIRSLVTDDIPPHVAEQVFGRYGIKITYQYLERGSAGNAGYSFLNQAKTSNGTYYNRVGSGMFQVFSFGEMAVRRMIQLQADEMKKRGLDPARTRVIEVEYGIIPTTRGYDLGVKTLKAMPLERGEQEAKQE